jgi:ribosomal protein S18 acetylase RimI-like enzyme
MPILCLHDKDVIEGCLRVDAPLHVYELGDLDDFYWPHTAWYGLEKADRLQQIALVYSASELPVLLALTRPPPDEMEELLSSLAVILPRRLYAHLTPELEQALADAYRIECHGRFLKMALSDPATLTTIDTSRTFVLTPDDLEEVLAFYRSSYPGNWFDPRMLGSGRYVGLRQDGDLVAVAGVHVYSPRYGVAALGNIATHPAYRGRGLATIVTARLCQELIGEVSTIGLNVRSDNAPAITCYTRLGFTVVAPYEEFTLMSK